METKAIVNHASQDSINAMKKVIVQFKVKLPKMNLTEIQDKDFCGPARQAEYVLARQMLMKFLKEHTLASLNWIGCEVAGKDHATVLHGVKTINNYCETNKLFRAEFERINSMAMAILRGQEAQEKAKLKEKEEFEAKMKVEEALIQPELEEKDYKKVISLQEERIKELLEQIEKLNAVNSNHVNQIEKLNYEIEGYKGSVRLLKRKLEIANLPFSGQLAFS